MLYNEDMIRNDDHESLTPTASMPILFTNVLTTAKANWLMDLL